MRTRMSLQWRVQVAAFTLAMVVAAAIGITNLALAFLDLPRTALAANGTAARLLGSNLDISLQVRVDDLRQLAESSLVWTALSDSQGRDIYLKPFLEDRNQAMKHGRVALLDYRGRFVAGQASLLAEGEGESTDLVREVLATGLPLSRMAPGDRSILLLGVPIFYVYTADVIGVLLGSIDLAGLLGRQTVADLEGRGVDLRLADRTWTLWRDAEAARGSMSPPPTGSPTRNFPASTPCNSRSIRPATPGCRNFRRAPASCCWSRWCWRRWSGRWPGWPPVASVAVWRPWRPPSSPIPPAVRTRSPLMRVAMRSPSSAGPCVRR